MKYSEIRHPLHKPSYICVDNQLLITTAILVTIRHKSLLITLKTVSYSKQKSKSKSENIKNASSFSYEIVIVYVSHLAYVSLLL